MTSNTLYIGIKGHVVALDRTTGTELWRTKLSASDFTNVVVDGGQIFATSKGELFCLDASGSIRWHNKLKGLGMGLVTIGSPAGDQLSSSAEKKRRDQAAAAAAGGAAAAS